MARISVVGAGLAGLRVALERAERGDEVVVYEAEETVGGRLATRTVDEFRLDRGFQVLFTAYPAVRECLDLEQVALRQYAPGAMVCRPGTREVVADPLRAPRHLPETLTASAITLRDGLRTLGLRRELGGRSRASIFSEPDMPAREWLADRGFSTPFIEQFARPLFGGISLDPTLEGSANVLKYVFGRMAAGAIAVPAAGMNAIPRQLAERASAAGATIRTNSPVLGVEADGTVRLADERVPADAAVVATESPTARELTGVEAIPTTRRGCTTQYFAFDGAPLSAGNRIMLNAGSSGPLHVVQQSAVVPESAPRGRQLLAATVPGSPEADDATVAAEARTTMQEWYPERHLDLELLATDRIPFAQFAQPPGIHRSLPAPDAPDGAIVLAGEYTAWSSIDGALESGLAAANALDGHLEE